MSAKRPSWTQDPDRILEVAIKHCLWDPAFAYRLVDRIAAWAHENPRQRDRLRELLKAPRSGMQPLPAVDYAATLAKYNGLIRDEKLRADDAVAKLAREFSTSEDNISGRLKKARKMLKAGELDEWVSVLR